MRFFHPFERPLVPATLVRRYHRFLSDLRLENGTVVKAHCVNSGSMEGLVRPGAPVWAMEKPGTGELRWVWELSEHPGFAGRPDTRARVGANTSRPNVVVNAMLAAHAIPELGPYDLFVAEKKYGENSRIDFLLESGGSSHYVEVKNVHLVYPDGVAYFPDSKSARATKHLDELSKLAAEGHRATVVFFVQRDDAVRIRPSDLHDPAFAAAARRAAAEGVRFLGLRVKPTLEGLAVAEALLPVDLLPYDTTPLARWRAEERPFSGWERPRKKAPAPPA
jgi:sugar fermentation stimulation protein A